MGRHSSGIDRYRRLEGVEAECADARSSVREIRGPATETLEIEYDQGVAGAEVAEAGELRLVGLRPGGAVSWMRDGAIALSELLPNCRTTALGLPLSCGRSVLCGVRWRALSRKSPSRPYVGDSAGPCWAGYHRRVLMRMAEMPRRLA